MQRSTEELGLTEDGQRAVEAIAVRHNVGSDAAYHLLMALSVGAGRQAQFNHPDLGGMGQWSRGGMIMVGDMFNNALKARVDALCTELAALLQSSPPSAAAASGAPVSSQSQSQSGGDSIGSNGASLFVPGAFPSRWPAELGPPSSTGSQNNLHYAVFAQTRRLAIEHGGTLTIYDTGDHRITGFSQQQSGGQSLTFTSQHGLVRLADLAVVSPGVAQPEAQAPAASPSSTPSTTSPAPAAASAEKAPDQPPASAPAMVSSDDEIFARLERLAELRNKDVITNEEFDAKKAELLARL